MRRVVRVSSPHRYCQNPTYLPACSLPSCVSSPHRYCQNEKVGLREDFELVFQALIGTAKTALAPTTFFAEDEFQALIGTAKTCDKGVGFVQVDAFQVLIGTAKTFPGAPAPPWKSRVSSPHRYCQNTRRLTFALLSERGFKPS